MSHAKQVGQGRQRGRCLSRLRPMKALPNETRTRRTIWDLVALSTLPAIWVNYQPLQVAQSLAEVLHPLAAADPADPVDAMVSSG